MIRQSKGFLSPLPKVTPSAGLGRSKKISRLGTITEVEAEDVKLEKNDLPTAVTLHELGLCMRDARRYDEAEEVLEQALKIKKAELGDDNLEDAVTLHGV